MIEWRRYLFFDHLTPWLIVGLLFFAGLVSASGTPQPGMNPFQGGQYQSTFRSGHQFGYALGYGFVGFLLGAGLDYVLRRGDSA